MTSFVSSRHEPWDANVKGTNWVPAEHFRHELTPLLKDHIGADECENKLSKSVFIACLENLQTFSASYEFEEFRACFGTNKTSLLICLEVPGSSC